MKQLLQSINIFLYNDFVFSPRYKVLRHVSYWIVHTLLWAGFWVAIHSPGSFGMFVINMLIWLPIFILYGYPMAYWAVPYFLLRGKIFEFLLLMLLWGIAGLYLDVWYKDYIVIPIQKMMDPQYVLPKGPLAWCYLCITTSAAVPMIIKFFKYWDVKQKDWLNVQQEKVTAELQLLKAQVHPHFLFNTLNNIYSFSLENSPKTPGLILKLSNLLSYMLYDCRAPEVRLGKELDIMKNYVELERERYGNKIDISWNAEGDINNISIAPLLMIPFIENAFKHGTSEQVEKSWLTVDISVKENKLRAKIANSKNEFASHSKNGIGIENVKKRLQFIYPDHHELKITEETNFYVVSLTIQLINSTAAIYQLEQPVISQPLKYEDSLPAYR
jgi:two-component system, LytTR family, sensor histidine kinase AlgZ